MLIAALAPLLARFNLKIDLRAAPDDQVQLTLVPQKLEGSKFEGAVLAPIALTATAAELDAELAKGEAGALHRLVAARKSLADQIADQEAADAKATAEARDKAAKKPAAAKPAATAAKPASSGSPTKAEAAKTASESVESPATPPADADASKPASLW
ncbi:MAG TPA: PRTRC system protein E [Beijerinckiaceae bacterium]|nr:PRTRC system protein E [Hyphomicrobiales bacterium]MCO5086027.1 PRTRC system protein E [Methylobacteriaceae bacterium]HPG03683.1 PRTRC system protein E [Rhodoblastus sp.]HRY01569.1 PRTRC system protein E [Beijerinckiaceae bacterium]